MVIIVIAVLYFTQGTKTEDGNNKTSDERKQAAVKNEAYQKQATNVKKIANTMVSRGMGKSEVEFNKIKTGKTANQIAAMSSDDIIKLLFDKGLIA